MQVELYFTILVMILVVAGSIYLLISTKSKLERFYDWLDQLQDKWKLRSPGDKRPVFPQLIFHYWLLKRAPWYKTFSIWWIKIVSILFVLMAVFFIYIIIFGILLPGRWPLPFP